MTSSEIQNRFRIRQEVANVGVEKLEVQMISDDSAMCFPAPRCPVIISIKFI